MEIACHYTFLKFVWSKLRQFNCEWSKCSTIRFELLNYIAATYYHSISAHLYRNLRNTHFRGAGTYVCVHAFICHLTGCRIFFLHILLFYVFVLFNVSLLQHHHTPIPSLYIRLHCSLYAIKHALFILWLFRLVNPRVVRACTIVLTDWEKITTLAIRSAVTILHRISVGCKMPAMLYQVSCKPCIYLPICSYIKNA